MADSENVADISGDIVITDKELFDQAIAPDPAPAEKPAPSSAPSAEPAQTDQPQRQPAPAGETPRDPQGRFAPKGQQPPQQPQAAPQQPQRTPEDHRVPLRELLEERERRQRIEAEANQMRQAWVQFQQQQAAAAAAQQTPQTIFDDPDGYLNARVMNPLRQEGQMFMMKVREDMSRDRANERFGEQAVNTALADISRIRNTPHGDVIFNQIMATGHPYGALMQWHQQARAQAAIGPDPNAWLRQKQQEWVKNPNAQKAVLDYLRQQQQATNRPPNVSLPPSLSSMPASSGRLDDQGDLSNESLYNFATK